jgi:SHS2 domain-containing protein
MSYQYLEQISYADAAFEADAASLEELFRESADAVTQLMVEDLKSIEFQESRRVELKESELSLLLHDFLQQLIYWKDVDELFLRVGAIQIRATAEGFELQAELRGQKIDPHRHALGTDVKAVTFHRLQVWQQAQRWKATVLVDV